jgi:NAD(P)-dependent dehydrogenase (short-subunit alcohol dehydrogenase family)
MDTTGSNEDRTTDAARILGDSAQNPRDRARNVGDGARILVDCAGKFDGAELRGAGRQDPNLQDPSLQAPNLRDPNLRDPNPQDSDLQDPNPLGSNLDGPNLHGKTAIVTGATGGIGYETALGLARHRATTILAGRNPDKGARALALIRQSIPGAKVRFETLDLASLASVARFAASVSAAQNGVIDILVNNAGVMGSPTRLVTEDGFEQQFGVNYLAHFALVARLKNALCAAPGGGRVVSVASLAHRRGSMNWDDLQAARSYQPMRVYAQSKLAMLIFALELQRRAEQNQWNLRSMAAHPGWARTDIITNGIGAAGSGGTPGIKARLTDLAFALVAQSAAEGARPSLFAAMSAEAKGGAYYGPTRLGETRGPPGLARVFPQAADPAAGARLWALSETLTGVSFSTPQPVRAPERA